MTAQSEDKYRMIDTNEAARLLGVSPETMVNWRSRSQGPAYIKILTGKLPRIRYRPIDLEQYMERVEPQN